MVNLKESLLQLPLDFEIITNKQNYEELIDLITLDILNLENKIMRKNKSIDLSKVGNNLQYLSDILNKYQRKEKFSTNDK